ncbi:hypothetical protein BH10BAC2_BH10BAC2_32550 [soil metagenome]
MHCSFLRTTVKQYSNLNIMPDTNSYYYKSFNCFESLFHEAKKNSVLLLDDEGVIMEVNTAFLASFGYNPEDVIGKNFSLLFTEEDLKKDLPSKEIARTLKEGQAYDNNYILLKDHTKTWVSGESILIQNDKGAVCILKIIQNINEQKLSEFSISRLNDFNESILRSIEDVVIVIDNTMQVVKANNAFYSLFGGSPAENVPKNFAALIAAFDTHKNLQKNIENLLQTKESFSNTEIEIKTDPGEEIFFEVSGSALQNTSEQISVLLVMHDISVQKKSARQREDIIGFVAHELKNPLANIMLCNQLMEQFMKEGNEAGISNLLQRSSNNVNRLNKMIQELYDATKLNSGNFELEIKQFNFIEMVEEAKDTIEVLHPAYRIIINGAGNIAVKGDRYRLIQVVTNYLSNAIKYSDGEKYVAIDIVQYESFIRLSVKDKGLGISATQLPYIFNRFFRAEKTKNMEGIGLGLFLCRQIIQAHHGSVWAESEEGKGSVFYFTVPI